jgi:SAM-dependent methyltransferase
MPRAVDGAPVASAHWTDELFLRHGEIFRTIHEHAWQHGEAQAQDVKRILERFGVASGSRILDAPCGIGRHATRLAKLAYRVVGVDLSPAYIARAQELAMHGGVADRTRYVVGDLRRLADAVPPDARPFDAALNLWTSIGYYDEATDLEIIRGYHGLVREGGLLLVETVNRDYLVRHFDPQGYEAFGDLVEIEERSLDAATSRMQNTWRFYRKSGEDLLHAATIPIDHRVYSAHELRGLLEQGGWTVEKIRGGLKAEDPSADISRILLVGRK